MKEEWERRKERGQGKGRKIIEFDVLEETNGFWSRVQSKVRKGLWYKIK